MKKLLSIELNPNRIYGLDILRALAILFVVAGHGGYLMPEARYKYVNFFIFDGVSIFFVLSGFLIGGILIKTLEKQRFDFKVILNFWVRRWFRTVPNYFLILIILLSLNIIFTENFSFYQIRYFLFSQNLFSKHPEFFPEAWSLSVEEWFYLLIPILIFIFIKTINLSIKKTIFLMAFGIIISITLFRYYRFVNLTIDTWEVWDLTLRKQVFTRLDSLMYGVIGAFTSFYFKDFWIKQKLIFFALGIILFIETQYHLLGFEELGLYDCVFSFSIISLATLFLLPLLSTLKTGNGILYKFFTYISLISYSMYLLNLSVVQIWILRSVNWSYLQNFNGYLFLIIRYVLYWFFTIVFSILVYKYFEIPTINLRDKLKVK